MKLEVLFSNLLRQPIESINEETSPRNTKAWDSLKHLELVMAIEGAYSVKFTMPEIIGLNSLGSIRKLLKLKGVDV
ncbi:MAG: acyl carrier protein [Alphaproteobacteria bacterium]|nr:acyl carrier protein [Alphaproteobacteria bacterium]